MGASSLIELTGPNKNENQIVRVLEYNLVLIPVIGALLRTPRSISEILIIDFFGVFTSPAAPYQ